MVSGKTSIIQIHWETNWDKRSGRIKFMIMIVNQLENSFQRGTFITYTRNAVKSSSSLHLLYNSRTFS